MLSTMIKKYWQVSLLKESPENTPYSVGLLLSFALLFYLIVISQWSMVETDRPLTLNQVLMAGALLCLSYSAYTYILLRVFKLQVRFTQTLSSLFAAHIIIHIFAYPLLAAVPLLGEGAVPYLLAFIIMFVYLFFTIILTAWQIMVTYFIYKSALSKDNLSAILATIGLFAANILVVSIVR